MNRYLLKLQDLQKHNFTFIDVPRVEGSTQVCYKLDYTLMALCVPPPSSDFVVLPPKLID
jgi:hypothetical protein